MFSVLVNYVKMDYKSLKYKALKPSASELAYLENRIQTTKMVTGDVIHDSSPLTHYVCGQDFFSRIIVM